MADYTKTAADGARRAWIGVGAPILGLVAIFIILAVATFASFARDQDNVFVQTSTTLVANGLVGRARAAGNLGLDYANWDEAFEHISARWDQEWVEDNIYSSVAEGMILFRSDGTIRFSWFNDQFAPQAAALRDAVARAGANVPSLRRLGRASTPAETVAHTYVRVGEQLVVIAVAPVTLEDAAARAAYNPLRGYDYLATIEVLDAGDFVRARRSMSLPEFRFSVSSEIPPSDTIALPVVAADGAHVGQLQWRHAHPGTASFLRQIWPVVLGLLTIGILAVLVARALVARNVSALAHAEAALESSRLKADFLTRVGHELRTPLNAIIGYAEIIEEESSVPETCADAKRIITAARHLNHLLNDIFDQSRIHANRMDIRSEVLPVAGFLAEIQGLMRRSAGEAGVALTTSSQAMAGYVVADHVRLRQCMLNLVANAIKFSPRGHVEISARTDVVDGREMVVFDIVDDGIGIAKDDLDNLFRPFGQANASISKKFGGTGLGLSIARDLARAMGGDITVQSEPNKGSTFSLSVPVATASALRAA